MKILLVAPFFFEPHRWMISAYKTALNLSKDNQVIVLTTGKKRYEKISNNLTIYRLKDYFLPDPINYSFVPKLFSKFFQLVKNNKPDIILVNKYMFYTSLVVLFARFKKIKIPIVVATDTFPGLNWHPRFILVDWVMKIYNYLIGIPILKKANKVILYHSGNIETAKKLKLNYTVIHNGIETEKITNAKPPTDLIKKTNEIWIGYVGRLESVKGWDLLAESALKITKKYKNIKFIFVGNKNGKDKLLEKYRHPQILFTGHRVDALGIYKLFDIFVLPSFSEGLPNALMEAMASGCVCIAHNVGGVKDLIEHKVNGLIINNNSPITICKMIQYCLDNKNLHKKLSTNAKNKIFSQYNWDNIVNEYIQLFDDIKK